MMNLKNIILGRPLRNDELTNEKLSRIWGVPIMASDAVSSVAYAIEEILLVLVPVFGYLSVQYLGIIALPIIAILLVLVFSYSQIIQHYPHGGGAYAVSLENIGVKTSLFAASALIIDYILTVAVSLSSATSAFLAAFPEFSEHRLGIALLCLAIVTLMNLRGVRESSKIFGLPTYAFILVMVILISAGLFGLATNRIGPIVYESVAQPTLTTVDPIFVFMLLKAFSSGCSALTGIEAVSDAVPSFKEPSQRNAKHVLYILGGIIIIVFGGSVFLASGLQVLPLEGQTVISQMGEAVFGRGIFFYVLQFATSFILLLASNTAYNGLPTLLSILAKDGCMPRQFAQRGAKLTFSNGILFIFISAGLLLIAFGAQTHALIPLYSVGVFLSFTLSQGGMVFKWIKDKEKGWQYKFLINVIGTFMTAVGALIVFLSKFADGAWMLAVAIPLIAFVMYSIKRHYMYISEQIQISDEDFKKYYRPSVSKNTAPCVVLVSSIGKSALKSLNYANAMTSNVVALHISTSNESIAYIQEKWKSCNIDIPLEIVDAPYRDITVPLQEAISRREAQLKSGKDLTVVMIKFVELHWYDFILHNQTTAFIERLLQTHRNVATVIVPYLYRDRRDKAGKPLTCPK